MNRYDRHTKISDVDSFWYGGDPSLDVRQEAPWISSDKSLPPETEAWLASIANDTVEHPDTEQSQPPQEQGEK